jgi:hypothetical protein
MERDVGCLVVASDVLVGEKAHDGVAVRAAAATRAMMDFMVLIYCFVVVVIVLFYERDQSAVSSSWCCGGTTRVIKPDVGRHVLYVWIQFVSYSKTILLVARTWT